MIKEFFKRNNIFLWWTVNLSLSFFIFIFNPPLAIYWAIVMTPMFIHDILLKFFDYKK